jgi:hypothetical protein
MEYVLLFIVLGILLYLHLRAKANTHRSHIDLVRGAGYTFDQFIDEGDWAIATDKRRNMLLLIDWHVSNAHLPQECTIRFQSVSGPASALEIPFANLKRVEIDRIVGASKQSYLTINVVTKTDYCQKFPASQAFSKCANCRRDYWTHLPIGFFSKLGPQLSDLFKSGAGIEVSVIDPGPQSWNR